MSLSHRLTPKAAKRISAGSEGADLVSEVGSRIKFAADLEVHQDGSSEQLRKDLYRAIEITTLALRSQVSSVLN